MIKDRVEGDNYGDNVPGSEDGRDLTVTADHDDNGGEDALPSPDLAFIDHEEEVGSSDSVQVQSGQKSRGRGRGRKIANNTDQNAGAAKRSIMREP